MKQLLISFQLPNFVVALVAAGLLAACSNPFAPPPTEPDATPALTFAEPADCTYGPDSCTLMVSDGQLNLTGTTSGATTMSYTINEGSSTPVTLTEGEFVIDIPGLNEGDNVITITIENEGGDTTVVVVIVINNPGANVFDPDDLTVYVSNNGSDNAGNIDVFNERFELQSVFMGGNNEGVEVDRFGDVYQAGDTDRGPRIRVISQLYTRENLAFDPDLDREIQGDNTGLTAPKGIELAEDAGLIIAADFGDSNLKVFNAADDGNVAPVATTDLAVAPWDVVYDPATDRLFVALTDGTVGVFDDYLDGYGANGPDRIITPARDGEKISDNLHGVAYDFGSDTLVVSDVGAATMPDQPGFKNDGSLYVLENASTEDGNVTPRRVVEGRWTLLGNPVDIILNGDEVRVAEKAGDFLLVFDNIFDPNSDTLGDEVMPDLVTTEIKPESLVAAPMDFGDPDDPGQTPDPVQNPDVTDLDDPTELDAVFAVSNTPDEGDDFVVGLEPDLSDVLSTFDTTGATTNPENLTFDGDGDGFLTFDDGDMPSQGGILVIDGLAAGRDTFDASKDRVIMGEATGLVGPKGLDVVGSLGVAIVADFGAQDIKVFSTDAEGNAAPLYVTDDLGDDTRSVWDLDYEPGNDTLFVAATDGTVLIYEGYSSRYGVDGPDRVITPTKGGDKVSANLHGIVYVASLDALILSDVGAATTPDQEGFDADGQLFTLEDLGDADGEVPVTARVRGSNTTLGNPVDLSYSGDTLYIAEKTKDTLITYDRDQILGRPGDWNIKPASSAKVDNVESVALAPAFLN